MMCIKSGWYHVRKFLSSLQRYLYDEGFVLFLKVKNNKIKPFKVDDENGKINPKH